MRKVLNPSTGQFLEGDKGGALAAIVGTREAALYWHSRQALPWTSLSIVIGTAYAMVTAFWHATFAGWLVFFLVRIHDIAAGRLRHRRNLSTNVASVAPIWCAVP